jgi:hypothetical protein
MTRLPCHRFRSNEVRLWLSMIASNLGNLWRRLVLPKRVANASDVESSRWREKKPMRRGGSDGRVSMQSLGNRPVPRFLLIRRSTSRSLAECWSHVGRKSRPQRKESGLWS